MAVQQFGLTSARIGKVKGEILAHAVPVEVLGITGSQKSMPKNGGDTIVYRRWLPYGGTTSNNGNQFFSNATGDRGNVVTQAHLTTEGVTPPAESLTPQDVTAVINQYSVLYGVTDRMLDLHEDGGDMPSEMKKIIGERMGLVREMIRYGVLKAGTNQFYGGTGTSRATVNDKVTLNLLRKITRSLKANHAKMVTGILAPSANISTQAVEAGYLVFAHTDCEADIRNLAGFVPVAKYGSRKPVHELEIGSVENFRFILSPELVSFQDAGAAVGATGCFSTTGSNLDVYPMIIAGEDAWGQLALRGSNSMDVTYLAPGSKDKNDPLGQRGYAGAKFYASAVVLNSGWYAVCNCAVTAL